MTPQRIQLSRKKGWRMPENTVKVDRSTKWGNPFCLDGVLLRKYFNSEENFNAFIMMDGMWLWNYEIHRTMNWLQRNAVSAYENALSGFLKVNKEDIQRELRGKNLACWCKPGEWCHADVLLKIANKEQP